MADFENFSIEEIKTIVASISHDLRGDWSENVLFRIECIIDALRDLKIKGENVEDDLKLSIHCFNSDDFDGRMFRGLDLYDYHNESGYTKKVYRFLIEVLNYPNCNLPRHL